MMNTFLLIVFLAVWGSLSVFSIFERKNSTLRLVHVLFRHGNRNPDDGTLIKGSEFDNEKFFPQGWGQLTNDGDRTEYKVGEFFRERYDDFLTNSWNINYLDVRTTYYNRTKMSAQLMLAGLYPPEGNQVWSRLLWQPIPYNYYAASEDKETYSRIACTQYDKLYDEILNSTEISNYLERYDELLSILANRTGTSVSIFDAYSYYFGFKVLTELGFPLEEWTEAIYPEPIHSLVIDYYHLVTNTTAIRRIEPGYLLRKILSDTEAKINGTIIPSSRKMFIYAAHDENIAAVLLGLNAFKLENTPPYGSFVIFEIHEIDGVWGIQLFYQNYDYEELHALKIPGCDYFCPFDEFYSLVEEILPNGDIDCYGS